MANVVVIAWMPTIFVHTPPINIPPNAPSPHKPLYNPMNCPLVVLSLQAMTVRYPPKRRNDQATPHKILMSNSSQKPFNTPYENVEMIANKTATKIPVC